MRPREQPIAQRRRDGQRDQRAASRITSVLVSASGRSRRPVSPPNANTGTNASAAISSDVRIAGANAPGRRDQPRRRRQPTRRRAAAVGLQPPVTGLQRDQLGVDGHAERDGDAAQAHDRRGDAEQPHRRERQQHDQRQRQHRHQRAAAVEQEHQHDQHDDRDLFGDRAQQRVLDAPRQLRAVVHHVPAARRAAAACARSRSPALTRAMTAVGSAPRFAITMPTTTGSVPVDVGRAAGHHRADA